MKAICIHPVFRSVTVVEGDIDQVMQNAIPPPYGIVQIEAGVGLACSPIGAVGSEAHLFWHSGLQEYFGGVSYIIGYDPQNNTQSVPEGWWMRTKRQVEFLGHADAARPRLKELVRLHMSASAPVETVEPRW